MGSGEKMVDKTKTFDIVIETLRKERNLLWKMTERNMTSEYIGMNIMDDIRLRQIEQLDEAIEMWKRKTNEEL